MAASQTGTFNENNGAYNGINAAGQLTNNGVPLADQNSSTTLDPVTIGTGPGAGGNSDPNTPVGNLGAYPGLGGGATGGLGALANMLGINPNTMSAIGTLLGVGGQLGGAALQQSHINDAIAYLKSIGAQASQQNGTSYGAGWNAYDNQNGTINSVSNGSNPWMQLLTNGLIPNINTLNGMLPYLTTGAQNLVYQDPTLTSYLGLETRPVDFLTGQAKAAGDLVGSGGQTANNSSIAARGQSLAGMTPLLSTGQAASMAIDQAGRANANAAQTARAQALARGGGAGAVAGAGAANGGLADFSDAALGNVAGSLQGALQGQQGLNLQQVLGGLNAQQGGAALQQSLLNTGLTQGLANATGASGLLANGIQQLLAGKTSAAGIGATLGQLFQGQNSQLGSAANSGLAALLQAAGLSGQQGTAFLNNAANALNTQASTGHGIADLLSQSPWAGLLTSLGALATPGGGGGGGNSGLGSLIGGLAGGTLGGILRGGGNSSSAPQFGTFGTGGGFSEPFSIA